MFSIPDGSFKRYENYAVKLSAKETKWTSLEVRTHPTFLETLTSKCDSGPVKLPGLSRNGPSLQLKNRFIFCPMKALLIQLRVIDREQGLEVNTNDMAKIRSMLPQLHEAEKKKKEKEASSRKRRQGPPEEMSVVLLKDILKEMGISIRNSSTKARLVEKVKQARAGQLEANGNRGQFSMSSTTITLNEGFSDQSYENKRYVQPCLYLLFHDPTEKRRGLPDVYHILAYSDVF